MAAEHRLFALWLLGLTLLFTAGYLVAMSRQSRRGRDWPLWRLVFWLAGTFVLVAAASPGAMRWAHADLRWHMGQHLLLGMLAPLLLVLSAPVTLMLRSVPVTWARVVVACLQSDLARFLCHPITTLMLNIGGMYLLYGTALYAASLQSPALHHLLHLHFILAGYLFCQAVLGGPDRMAARHGAGLRLGVLLAAIAFHSLLGKLAYGYLWPAGLRQPAEQVRSAAQLMYYGGDLVEMLMLVLLLLGGRLTRRQPLPLVRV